MSNPRWTAWLLRPPLDGPRAIIAVRLMAGTVFLWEGILKFVYANQGLGRFTKLGMPFPEVTASFVGGLEIVGGLLLILGLGTRLISIAFVVEMLVAMLSTKPRLFLGTSPLPPPPVPPQVGIWAVLHEIRSEYAQLMSCIFLCVAGPGPWSLDASLTAREGASRTSSPQAAPGAVGLYAPDRRGAAGHR
jgi:putative oxidoreductase